MKLNQIITKVGTPLLMAALAVLTTGCDKSFIFDYEGDCDPKYRIRLRYDMNLKFADAFPNEVKAVTLNVVDKDGRIVHTHIESGEALAAEGYEVEVPLEAVTPGEDYSVLAWCGEGALPGSNSFHVPHGSAMATDMNCTLLADPEARADVNSAAGTTVNRYIEPLYHGLTEPVNFPNDEGTHYVTVPLTKNTNTVQVMLQHLSGVPMDENDFEFTITSANAHMAHDNSLQQADPVTYKAWSVRQGLADIEADNAGTLVSVPGVVAEFEVARLTTDDDIRLTITRRSDGSKVLSIPLLSYALIFKGERYRNMDDQEYLDRQDQYNFVFFLDSQYKWVDAIIYINSWKWVRQDAEI